jgi:hypothetical protein
MLTVMSILCPSRFLIAQPRQTISTLDSFSLDISPGTGLTLALRLSSASAIYGPDSAAKVPLYLAFVETALSSERVESADAAVAAMKLRASAISSLPADQVGRLVQMAFSAGAAFDLAVPASSTGRVSLRYLATRSYTPLGVSRLLYTPSLKPDEMDLLAKLRTGQNRAAALFRFVPEEDALSALHLVGDVKSAIAGADHVTKLFLAGRDVRVAEPNLATLFFSASSMLRGVARPSLAEDLQKVQDRLESLTTGLASLLNRYKAFSDTVSSITSGTINAETLTNGTAQLSGMVRQVGALLNLPSDTVEGIAQGVEAAGSLVLGVTTGNPIAIIAGVSGIAGLLFGGGDSAQKASMEALKALQSSLNSLRQEIRAEFDDIRDRLRSVEDRLVDIRARLDSLSEQMDRNQQQILARFDEIKSILSANLAVQLRERFTEFESAVRNYERGYHSFAIARGRDPALSRPTQLDLASDTLLDNFELLKGWLNASTGVIPGIQAGLAHPSLMGAATLDSTLDELANRGSTLTAENVRQTAVALAAIWNHPTYDRKGAIVADLLGEIMPYLPVVRVSDANRRELAVQSGEIVSDQFRPWPAPVAAAPADVWMFGSEMGRLLGSLSDREQLQPLLQEAEAALGKYGRMLQLTNSSAGWQMLGIAYRALASETLQAVERIFYNPISFGLFRLGQSVRLLAGGFFRSSEQLHASFGISPAPVDRFFTGPKAGVAPPAFHVSAGLWSNTVLQRKSQAGLARLSIRTPLEQTRQALPQDHPQAGEFPSPAFPYSDFGLKPSLDPVAVTARLSTLTAAYTDLMSLIDEIASFYADNGLSQNPQSLSLGATHARWMQRFADVVNTRLDAFDQDLDVVLQMTPGHLGLRAQARVCCRKIVGLLVLETQLRRLMDAAAGPNVTERSGGVAPKWFTFGESLGPYARWCLVAMNQSPTLRFSEAFTPRISAKNLGTVPLGFVLGPRDVNTDFGGAVVIEPGRIDDNPIVIDNWIQSIEGEGLPDYGRYFNMKESFTPITGWLDRLFDSISNRDVWMAGANVAGLAGSTAWQNIRSALLELQLGSKSVQSLQALPAADFEAMLTRELKGLF